MMSRWVVMLMLATGGATATAQTELPHPKTATATSDDKPKAEEKETLTEAGKKALDEYLKEREKKAVEPGLPLRAYWDNGLWFKSEDKDTKIHLGGRLQFQPVWWSQPTALKGPPPGPGGLPASQPGAGVGVLDDGMFFRRVRLRSDGTIKNQYEYVIEVNFEQLNYVTFDHLWFGMKDLPLLGTVRIGQHKVPQGLEMIGSDYHLTFLERSSLSDAFWTLFAPGIFIMENACDERMVWQSMFHRIQPLGFYTSDFGGGDYAATTRLTGLPIYECDGECLLHLGLSYQWRRADLGRSIQPGGTGSAYGDSQNVLRYRARPELRDATGIQTTLGGNPARFIDTGSLTADFAQTLSPELLIIKGPFSVQAESAFVYTRNAKAVDGDPAALAVNPFFWGGYAEVSYILTGEHRGYDKRMGMYDRITVAHPFQHKKGCCIEGWGAWQVAYRYSHIDLNDRGINGGLMNQHTFSLNWYLNDNTKIQFQYSNIERMVPTPAVSGTVHGFGVLGQFYF